MCVGGGAAWWEWHASKVGKVEGGEGGRGVKAPGEKIKLEGQPNYQGWVRNKNGKGNFRKND